ncbi:molybdate ABC transporter substrate-binding protein [Aquimarina agarivorans]|uniref:molybdate ABC transporter substrate-binding protein n=1 Tax=Aquimarina agarivorans TaxID=980584 RepID=UPI001300C65A|nr:molybdate ABC transporter substrate-binding protein [Aquimarina agarivorans]
MNSCNTQKKEPLLIAAASNMSHVLTELNDEFEQQTGIAISLITASSGKLTAQLMAGAPYDVFISASAKYPKHLISANKKYEQPITVATGKLIMISNKKIESSVQHFITSTAVKKIAIPNPKIAPYGLASEELLHNWGVYQHVAYKLVFGESVGQTNQFILSGAADVGFTSKSLLFVNNNTFNKQHYREIDKRFYKPLEHQLVITSNNETTKTKAGKYANFMRTEKAKTILKKYGYDVPE